MEFLKSYIGKFPYLYILFKSPNFKIAKLNFKAYKLIKKHNLFNENYYLNKNENLKNLKIDPLLHYIFFGYMEGKDPSPDFDSFFYVNNYYDAKMSKLNPLVHYALYDLNKRETKLDKNKIQELNSVEIDKFLNKEHDFSNTNINKRILYITHEKISNLGGTGHITLDIINQLNKNYESYILSSNNGLVELWKIFNDKLEKIANWNVDIKKPAIIHDYNNKNNDNDLKNYFYNEKLRDIYFNIIHDLKIDLIHISHLINHSNDLIDISKFFNVPYILNIHDFYYFCPSIHLLNNEDNYCEINCLNDNWNCKISSNTKELVKQWREYSIEIINSSNLAIFPSNFSFEFYKNNFKGIDENKLKIIEPGRDFKNKSKSFTILDKFPVKILFTGHISPHKGSLFIRQIKKLDKKNKLEFHFLGTTVPNLNKYGINHGRYERDKIDEYFKDIKPSFIGLFSTCPETYSHTLTESWNSNIPPIATNLGAFKERINKTNGGFLIDYKSPEIAYNEIIKIIEDKDKYIEITENISKIELKPMKEMLDEYIKIYADLIND
ncbi:glycosyltransferase [Methanobrevibacter sp. DSM 116169]|uniref:glycosyltransferase n=1 Tax=Methanobrevibacter sp. DSM 116169 TaxID=3242727 RepID=UPI0038FC6AEC